jgi:hypothetical protein
VLSREEMQVVRVSNGVRFGGGRRRKIGGAGGACERKAGVVCWERSVRAVVFFFTVQRECVHRVFAMKGSVRVKSSSAHGWGAGVAKGNAHRPNPGARQGLLGPLCGGRGPRGPPQQPPPACRRSDLLPRPKSSPLPKSPPHHDGGGNFRACACTVRLYSARLCWNDMYASVCAGECGFGSVSSSCTPASTWLTVREGFQPLSSLRMDRHTVPEG